MHPEVKALIKYYQFDRLPAEGTFFVSTYRSEERYPSGQHISTAMIGMYCDEPRSVSLFHKLTVDELWHFYGGDPMRLVLLYPDGSSRDVIMGSNPTQGQVVQFTVPAGVWQAGHVAAGGRYALFGCTMAPGFTGEIFTGGTPAALLEAYPDRAADIELLCCEEGDTHMPDGFVASLPDIEED